MYHQIIVGIHQYRIWYVKHRNVMKERGWGIMEQEEKLKGRTEGGPLPRLGRTLGAQPHSDRPPVDVPSV